MPPDRDSETVSTGPVGEALLVDIVSDPDLGHRHSRARCVQLGRDALVFDVATSPAMSQGDVVYIKGTAFSITDVWLSGAQRNVRIAAIPGRDQRD